MLLRPNSFSLNKIFWRQRPFVAQKIKLVCLYFCRQLLVFACSIFLNIWCCSLDKESINKFLVKKNMKYFLSIYVFHNKVSTNRFNDSWRYPLINYGGAVSFLETVQNNLLYWLQMWQRLLLQAEEIISKISTFTYYLFQIHLIRILEITNMQQEFGSKSSFLSIFRISMRRKKVKKATDKSKYNQSLGCYITLSEF